jgi:regulator of replication initiation timing
MVDLRTAFDIALSLITFLGGWLMKTLFDRIDKLEEADNRMTQALNDLRVELPSRYVDKEDFIRVSNKMLSTLERIEDKLDKKVDK